MDVLKEKVAIPAQRQQAISSFLAERMSITIQEAAELCKVSEATARRDLDSMAADGLLERTHGGAVLHRGTGFEELHSEKLKIMVPQKTKIALSAAEIIKNGDSIYLDSGTTTYLLAEQLASLKHITVVTNNLDIAYFCKLDSTSTMIVTGGMRREGYSILVGDLAQNLIKNLCVDYAFVGVDAIDVNSGVFCSNFSEIGVKTDMLHAGKKTVIMADSSKFKKKALAKLCDLSDIDILITDDGIGNEEREILRERVGQLIIAET